MPPGGAGAGLEDLGVSNMELPPNNRRIKLPTSEDEGDEVPFHPHLNSNMMFGIHMLAHWLEGELQWGGGGGGPAPPPPQGGGVGGGLG